MVQRGPLHCPSSLPQNHGQYENQEVDMSQMLVYVASRKHHSSQGQAWSIITKNSLMTHLKIGVDSEDRCLFS